MPTLNLLTDRIIERRSRGTTKRLIKPPRQPVPISQEREYKRDLSRLTDWLKTNLEKIIVPRLADIERQANFHLPETVKLDAWDDEIRRGMSAFRVEYERNFTNEELAAIAKRRATEVNNFNRRGFNRQFKTIIGVDPFLAEPWLGGQLAAFATQNVNLIKTVPEKFFSEIENLVFSGLQSGKRWEEIATELRDRAGVAESRVELIARDQVSKLNGQLTKLRQTEIGVKGYIWSTSQDERVRDSHRAKEGKHFTWDNPPVDTGHPGEDINCRCVALPDLLRGLPEEE